MVSLELYNITSNTVGLEMVIDLAKGFNNTMSDFTKPEDIAG